MNTFDHLQDLLGEMQRELALRDWQGDTLARNDLAADLRVRLYRAISAYRDEHSNTIRALYK